MGVAVAVQVANAEYMYIDAADTKRIPALFGEVCAKHHRLDTLLYNAVACTLPDLNDSIPKYWDIVLKTNLIGPYSAARKVLAMLGGDKGQYCNYFVNQRGNSERNRQRICVWHG